MVMAGGRGVKRAVGDEQARVPEDAAPVIDDTVVRSGADGGAAQRMHRGQRGGATPVGPVMQDPDVRRGARRCRPSAAPPRRRGLGLGGVPHRYAGSPTPARPGRRRIRRFGRVGVFNVWGGWGR